MNVIELRKDIETAKAALASAAPEHKLQATQKLRRLEWLLSFAVN